MYYVDVVIEGLRSAPVAAARLSTQALSRAEKASGKQVPYQLADRRPGDIAECWADPAKAQKELDWNATRTLTDMTEDTWRWQSTNPDGFPG